MSKPKVIATRRWPEPVEAHLFENYDFTLNEDDHPMSVDELHQALREYDAVCPTVTDPITAEVLGIDGIRAKILGNFGVGFNHIDLDAAKQAGLVVTNTPEVLTDCTADIAMNLLLTAARRTGEGANGTCAPGNGPVGARPTCWRPRSPARPWAASVSVVLPKPWPSAVISVLA